MYFGQYPIGMLSNNATILDDETDRRLRSVKRCSGGEDGSLNNNYL